MLTAPDCVLADDVPCSLVVEMLPTSAPPPSFLSPPPPLLPPSPPPFPAPSGPLLACRGLVWAAGLQ